MTTCQRLDDLETPSFIVNRQAFQSNCKKVKTSAYANGIVRLRPHVKTHKTKEGCLIQAGLGSEDSILKSKVIGFVGSTIPELRMLTELAIEHGPPFTDVLYGIPICKLKLPTIETLRNKMVDVDANIHLLVDNMVQLDALESTDIKWSVFIKVDTGYHRAGVTCDDQGVSIATRVIESTNLSLKGLYSHCGHSYNINNNEEMKKIVQDDHSTVVKFLKLLDDHLKLQNIPFDTSSLDISVGSTPSVFSHEKLDIPNNVELHPGNYVFYDRQQQYTGVCESEDSIASLVLSRVIGHYPDHDRNAIMIDAGATALTKETTPQGDMASVYGRPELQCYRMSQEITMIRCRDGSPFPFDDFPLGSTLLLLPNHSCLAAACFEEYHVVDEVAGQLSISSKIVDKWKPVKDWK